MVRDPEQLFVMNAITRKWIAENLQDCRKFCGYKHPIGPQEIAEDDDRLTDEICEAFAKAVGEIDQDFNEETQDDLERTIITNTLEAMGYVAEEEDEEEAYRAALIREVSVLESELARKRAMLDKMKASNEEPNDINQVQTIKLP